jgi:hypothetical protein
MHNVQCCYPLQIMNGTPFMSGMYGNTRTNSFQRSCHQHALKRILLGYFIQHRIKFRPILADDGIL